MTGTPLTQPLALLFSHSVGVSRLASPVSDSVASSSACPAPGAM